MADKYFAEYRAAWDTIVPHQLKQGVSELLGTHFKGRWLQFRAAEERADEAAQDERKFRIAAGEALVMYRHLLADCVHFLQREKK